MIVISIAIRRAWLALAGHSPRGAALSSSPDRQHRYGRGSSAKPVSTRRAASAKTRMVRGIQELYRSRGSPASFRTVPSSIRLEIHICSLGLTGTRTSLSDCENISIDEGTSDSIECSPRMPNGVDRLNRSSPFQNNPQTLGVDSINAHLPTRASRRRSPCRCSRRTPPPARYRESGPAPRCRLREPAPAARAALPNVSTEGSVVSLPSELWRWNTEPGCALGSVCSIQVTRASGSAFSISRRSVMGLCPPVQ